MMKRSEKDRIKVCNLGRKTYKLTAMAHPIRPDYKQTYLFPYSWEELIPVDHPFRFIRGFVDALGLEGVGFYREYEGFGRRRYSANLLLK